MRVLDLLLAIAVIGGLASILGAVARWLHQPAVVGHLLAGVVLGPSILGAVSAHLTQTLIPLDTRHDLSLLAQLALILFMFSLGYELDRRQLGQRMRAVPAFAAATFVVPLVLGGATAFLLADAYRPRAASASAFILFVAVATAVSALPVLASIVREHGLTRSVPAGIAMTSAAVVDALAWLLLTVALLEGKAGTSRSWVETLALLGAFALVMALAVRPLAATWLRRSRPAPALKVAVAAAIAIGAGWVTTELGLHAVLGAFFAGLMMPRGADGEPDGEILRPILATGVVMLPLFLTLSGLSTNIGALDPRDIAVFALVLGVAVAGKLGMGWLAGRASGLTPRDAAIAGVLLNTRGVTELVVLSIGLKAGIIGAHLYTVFVLMALVTSAATGPLLTAIRRADRPAELGTGRSRAARSPAAS